MRGAFAFAVLVPACTLDTQGIGVPIGPDVRAPLRMLTPPELEELDLP